MGCEAVPKSNFASATDGRLADLSALLGGETFPHPPRHVPQLPRRSTPFSPTSPNLSSKGHRDLEAAATGCSGRLRWYAFLLSPPRRSICSCEAHSEKQDT